MTIEELIKQLEELAGTGGDVEINHSMADKLLLEYIGDDRVREAFDRIEKWYA